MTTHYTIQLTNYKIDFKATYRDGKFRKLEHLRGRMNQSLMDSLGKVIPQLESELETFIKKFAGRVSYTKEAGGQKTAFTKFKDAWFAFYQKEHNRKPKFTGADGKALNQTIKYLVDEHNDEAAALTVWSFILENWHHLSEFYRKQQDLKIINSKLNVIITELSNKHTSNERTFRTAAESESARAFKFGNNSK